MSAIQELIEQAKSVWKALALLGGLATVSFTAGLALPSGPVDAALLSQVATHTRTLASHSAAIDSLRTESRSDRAVLNFLACGQENRINGQPESLCLRYLTGLTRGER